ncbi:ESC4 [Sanghuangporus weigelae]
MLFNGVRYTISPTLAPQRQIELSKLLDANGATLVDFSDATHVISNTLQFDGRELVSTDVQIITDEWVDRSIVQGKLQETRYFSADPIMIFSGVVACVADLEPCDTEVIAAGINALGGLFREGYTRDCTHVLAARPDSDKYLTAMHYATATRVKVVLPHWFDDCFKLLLRLPEDSYVWPDPPLLRTNYALSKARLDPSTKALVKASVLEEESADKITAQVRSDRNIWHGKSILLSSTLNLADGRREAVEASVKRSGGVIVQLSGDEVADVDSADVYVTLHRVGMAFMKAVRANKTVGTLSWLFSVQKSSIVISPLDQLLHFPSPLPPLHGFENHKITATNYEGDARRYLKKLIELMGGSFTPQMTAQNTVVVAAYIKGEKSTKAREWNIPIVNHTWLEDCFASWTLITPAQEKYVSFPPGVNFGDLVCRRNVAPLTDEELAEIERVSLEAAVAVVEKQASTEQTSEVKNEAKRPASSSGSPRIWNTPKTSPTRPTGGRTSRSQEESRANALKPAAARLNAQQEEQREVEEKEQANEEEDSQPPRTRDRSVKRKRESGEYVPDDQPTLRRGIISPTKRLARSHARSDVESEEEDDMPRRIGRSIRPVIASSKTSPTKYAAKSKASRSEDESDNEPPPRRLGRSDKLDSGQGRLSKSSPKKYQSALDALNDDEFASSDEGLSPIKLARKPAFQQSTNKKKKSSKRRSRTTESAEEEEEEEEDVAAPRKSKQSRNTARPGPSKHRITGQEPRTPLRKQTSLPGPTPGKNVYVEIPSPRKSSQMSRVHSMVAAAADEVVVHATPKRGRPAPRILEDRHEREDDSPAEESPSRSSHFSSDAVRRSSQPNPIISSTFLQRTPSKRQAASKASAKLHENALDIIKFEKEKRSGRFRGAWEDGSEKAKARSSMDQSKHDESRKRRSSAFESESDAEDADARNKKKRKSGEVENDRKVGDTGKKSKKARISTPISDDEEEARVLENESDEDTWDSSDIRLMTTQVTLSDQILKGLRQFGVQEAKKPTECNLLLANSIGRTEKFLCTMATARSIVTEAWAVESVKAKQILPPEKYFLKDPEGEKKYKFKLADALRRAQSSETKLLEGHTFYFTKGLHRNEKFTTYKNIILSAGGKVVQQNPTVRILSGHEDRHVISTEADNSVTGPLKDEGFHIYVPEFILVGILTQRMDWDTTPHRLDRN